MPRTEQQQFIRNLTRSLAGTIISAIEREKIPEHWDGLQLRYLLADKARDAAYIAMTRTERRDYNNIKLVNNL